MTYIEETQIYIQMIEVIRKQRKISIDTLLEGITSERSYRRYLHKDADIPLDILTKLMKALDVSVIDMIIYTLQVIQKPSGVIELLQFTHYQNFDLAKPYHEMLKHYEGDKVSLTYLVKYFILLYEYHQTQDLETFHHGIQFLSTFDMTDIAQLENFSLYVLTHIHISKKDIHLIHDMFLNKNLYYYNILLYTLILDMYLTHYIKEPNFDRETYQKLSIHLYETSHKWLDSYPIYASQLHYAYQFFLHGDIESCHKQLFNFINQHILTQSQPLTKEKSTLLYKMIDTDVETFMTHYLNQILHVQ
jgi:DNA-binding Xre family transcriptional regulator